MIAGLVLALFIAAGRGLLPTPTSKDRQVLADAALGRLLSSPWLSEMPVRFLAMVVPCFLIAMVFAVSQVPHDVGYLSIIVFGIVLLGLSLSSWIVPYFVRGGLYVGTTFLLYVSEDSALRSVSAFAMTHDVFFIVVAIMVLLSLRFNEQSRFQTTPLDYLMVFLAIAFPLLPEVSAGISHLGIFAAKLMVLFFSFELLLHVFSDRVRQLGLVSLWVLFGLGIRTWF
jgi:UDP-GlcNAc:undecaprenyl-phosphate GlcNAc-1-phosphate transferase